MISFSFSDEQNAFRQNLQAFVQKELLPFYTRWDREKTFPRETWRKMGKLGLTGMRVSAEYGGSEVDCVTSGIAAEEVGKGDFNAGYAVMLNALIGEILEQHGSSAIKQKWLKPFATGELLMGIAVTEPEAGSDAAAMKTKAVRDGDGYVISGEKSGISLALAADAFIIFAKTNPELGAKGVTAFIVPADADGVEVQGYEDMGNVPIGRGSIFLDQVRVPAENLIGREGQGFYQVMNGFDLSRVLIALQCIGAAEQTLAETMSHVKKRRAFGQPLAKFEGVSFPIAEHHTWLEMARWQCYRTLWLRDQGLPHTKEAAMCKWIGPNVARHAIHDCLLLHGHYGYTKEMPIEQRLRDVIGLEIGDGTAQTQKIVIARELLGKAFKPY
jgi:cyclohexanecarboxyl-CoA dehydrogenase